MPTSAMSTFPIQLKKIELYKRAMAIQSLEEADDVEEIFWIDSGLLPKSVQNLVNIARIKVLARKIGVATITNFKEFFPLSRCLKD